MIDDFELHSSRYSTRLYNPSSSISPAYAMWMERSYGNSAAKTANVHDVVGLFTRQPERERSQKKWRRGGFSEITQGETGLAPRRE
jgi:hypothetical protein